VVRLKRVFAKIDQRQHEWIRITATEETARDLEWFMQRFPLETVDEAKQEVDRRSAAHKERMSRVEEILAGRVVVGDFGLAQPLREYQQIAAEVAFARQSLLLADDVGLGKTAVAIGLMARNVTLPALVVTLTHLPRQWQDELGKFAPHLSTHIIKTGQPYDIVEKHCRRKSGPRVLPDVILISYSKLSKWAPILAPIVRTVVYDEVQELRRSGSDKASAARHISGSSTWRLGLSATPIYNYGSEIWNVMQSIAPDALGSFPEFIGEWCTGMDLARPETASIKNPHAFGSYMRESGLMLRRTRKDVGRELLPLTKIVQHIDADTKALEQVGAGCAELARAILRTGEEYRGQKMHQSEEFSNLLRQATGIAKAPYVAEFVRMLLESEQRVVLYGWHREVYSIWRDRLKEFNPVLYTGSESPEGKAKAKDAFTKGDSRVLLISLRAGAGLDGLQHFCRTIVFGELDWSPGVHEQCLSDDTEILTPNGFKKRGEISQGDPVAAFDTKDGSISWEKAEAVIDRELAPGEQMFGIEQPGMSLRVTGDHRVVFREANAHKRRSEVWDIAKARTVAGRTQGYHIPVAGIQQAPGLPLTDDEVRLLGWFVTDGNINHPSRTLTICQAESSPFNEHIVRCLTACGLHFTVNKITKDSQWKRRSPLIRYCVPKYGPKEPGYLKSNRGWLRFAKYLDKDLSPHIEEMDSRQLSIFLEAADMGDGSTDSGDWVQATYRLTSGNRNFVDRLQSLCVRRGWRANIKDLPDGNWLLHVKPMAYRSIAGTSQGGRPMLSPVSARESERVWCVRNRLGTIVVRRNGKVAITGNCEGRILRDGQTEPVCAYYLVSDGGSDPSVAEALGVKRQQIRGLRHDADGALFEQLQNDGNRIKDLARSYLAHRGGEMNIHAQVDLRSTQTVEKRVEAQ
jgi:hypothetical protein